MFYATGEFIKAGISIAIERRKRPSTVRYIINVRRVAWPLVEAEQSEVGATETLSKQCLLYPPRHLALPYDRFLFWEGRSYNGHLPDKLFSNVFRR